MTKNHIVLFDTVERMLCKKDKIIIAIDGPCGSGKTTLANLIAGAYSADIISMDYFFLPPALRTQERLAEPGGNIHYERFIEEVANPLREGREIEFSVFDCSIMELNGKKKMNPGRITVIEGSYSMHPLYANIYDLKVFTTCPQQERQKRILERSGEQLYRRFLEEWIPMEDLYFEKFNIKDGCSIIINT